MKYIYLSIVYFLCFNFSSAQTPKKELTERDKDYLKKELLSHNTSLYSLSLSINTGDLTPLSNIKPEKEHTIEQVKELEKTLKGNFDDYSVYNNIGQIYKSLNQKDKAFENYKKAFELLNEKMEATPHDSLYKEFALILMNAEDMQSAISYYEKAMEVNPNDSCTAVILPFCYLYAGDLVAAKKKGEYYSKKYPTYTTAHLTYLLTILYNTMYSETMRGDTATGYSNKKIEEILDVSYFKSISEKYPDNYELKLFYELGRQVGLILKIYKQYSKDKIQFVLSDYDKSEIQKLEKFYQNGLKDKKISSKYEYVLNKALGILYLMNNKPKQAIPFLEKSIKIKKPEYSNINSNPGESYDALITAYMFLKDTLSAKKVAEQKVLLKPEINPNFKNYVSLCNYNLVAKNVSEARKAIDEAIKLNESDYDVLMAEAIVNVYEGNLKKAEDLAMKIYKLNDSSTDAFFLMSVIYLLKNDFNSAYYCLKRMQEIEPESKTSKDILSKYFN